MIAYAISEPSLLKSEIDLYLSHLKDRCDIFLYRDKFNPNYKIDAKYILQKSKEYGIDRVFLHSDIDTAYNLKADGIHLTSSQFEDIKVAKAKGLFTVISTHSIDEIKKAQNLGADMVTLSPIFASPNKGKPLGLEYLKEATKVANIPIIALGGIISQDNIKSVISSGADGFASIRYFIPE